MSIIIKGRGKKSFDFKNQMNILYLSLYNKFLPMGKKSSFSTISTGVFERTGTDAVSTQKFYTTLA